MVEIQLNIDVPMVLSNSIETKYGQVKKRIRKKTKGAFLLKKKEFLAQIIAKGMENFDVKDEEKLINSKQIPLFE